MIYVDVKNMGRLYEKWRKLETAKGEGEDIPTWKEWKQKAVYATRKLKKQVKENARRTYDDKLFKDIRRFLEYLFHDKCGYCERWGEGMEMEHYRPRARVTAGGDGNEMIRFRNVDGEEENHPGYYWLVYEPKNLILSCGVCNKEKSTKFPIRGPRARCPKDSADDEAPLLLHPYHTEKPRDHFQIDEKRKGGIAGDTAEGKETVMVCGLNREKLADARQEAWEDFVDKGMLLKFMKRENVDFEKESFSFYIKLRIEEFINDAVKGMSDRLFQ